MRVTLPGHGPLHLRRVGERHRGNTLMKEPPGGHGGRLGCRVVIL